MEGAGGRVTEGWIAPGGIAQIQHAHEDIGSSISWFRSHVSSLGLAIAAGSALDIALGRTEELRELFSRSGTRRFDSRRQELRWHGDAFGADFMTKLAHRAVRLGLSVPRRLWSALLDPAADVVITRAGTAGQSRDLTWELMLGCACQLVASDVVFEEPDVKCSFLGASVAIAAKVSYKPGNIWTNAVDKGFRQAAGRGQVGLVAVNVANILPLGRWLDASRRQPQLPGPRWARRAAMFAAAWCETALSVERVMPTLAERFRTDRVPSGVMFFMPLMLMIERQPNPFFYFHMPMHWSGATGPDFEFVSALCQGNQVILDRVE